MKQLVDKHNVSQRGMSFADIDFLIIGAAKSATTWLQHVLQDAGAAMPSAKLDFFSSPL